MQRLTRPGARGFTLIELVLVLAVIAVLMAVAAPSLRGFARGSKLREAANEFLAATRWARSEAVTKAVPHRLEVDSAGQGYALTRLHGGQVVSAAGEFGRTVVLPVGVRIEVTREDGDASGILEFRPTGRTSPARVRLTADWGEMVELIAATPAEPFRQVTPE